MLKFKEYIKESPDKAHDLIVSHGWKFIGPEYRHSSLPGHTIHINNASLTHYKPNSKSHEGNSINVTHIDKISNYLRNLHGLKEEFIVEAAPQHIHDQFEKHGWTYKGLGEYSHPEHGIISVTTKSPTTVESASHTKDQHHLWAHRGSKKIAGKELHSYIEKLG